MPFVLKKNSGSYEWPVTVESPSSGGKFRKDTFKALFKKLSRSEFGALAEQGEDALVTEILDGWKVAKDEEGEEDDQNDDDDDDDDLHDTSEWDEFDSDITPSSR